jgi:hypothetical protein
MRECVYISGNVKLFASGKPNSLQNGWIVSQNKVTEVNLYEAVSCESRVLSRYRFGNYIHLKDEKCLVSTGLGNDVRTTVDEIVCYNLTRVFDAEVNGENRYAYSGCFIAKIEKPDTNQEQLPVDKIDDVLETRRAPVENVRPTSSRRKKPFDFFERQGTTEASNDSTDGATVDPSDKQEKAGCHGGFGWLIKIALIIALLSSIPSTVFSLWFIALVALLVFAIITSSSAVHSGNHLFRGAGFIFPLAMVVFGVSALGWSSSVLWGVSITLFLVYLFWNSRQDVKTLISMLVVVFFLTNLLDFGAVDWERWKETDEISEDDYELPEQNRSIVEDSLESDEVVRKEVIKHFLSWRDYEGQFFDGTYSVYAEDAGNARFNRHRVNMSLSTVQEWGKLYQKLEELDKSAIDLTVSEFQRIALKNKLNSSQVLDMVVTSVQSIPYYLLHEGGCSEASSVDDFMRDYHRSGRPCLANCNLGLQSPSEFLENVKGDCDTRTLFLHQVLKKMGFDCVVLVSIQYGHAMLGVNFSGRGDFVRSAGRKYFFWETTAPGWKLGQLPPQTGNSRYWEVALK